MSATVTLGEIMLRVPLPSNYSGGYVGFGTGGFYPAQFDDFEITYGECGDGDGIIKLIFFFCDTAK